MNAEDEERRHVSAAIVRRLLHALRMTTLYRRATQEQRDGFSLLIGQRTRWHIDQQLETTSIEDLDVEALVADGWGFITAYDALSRFLLVKDAAAREAFWDAHRAMVERHFPGANQGDLEKILAGRPA